MRTYRPSKIEKERARKESKQYRHPKVTLSDDTYYYKGDHHRYDIYGCPEKITERQHRK